MSQVRTKIIALAVGAAIFTGGALDAVAQDDEGVETASVPAGTLDDGQELLAQAGVSIEAAVRAAQGAATGAVGEIDLEYSGGALVFNVDIGNHDVKVDAASGAVLAVDTDD